MKLTNYTSGVPVALPSHCEKHPTAMIRHSWNETHYILNGLPSGEGIKSEHTFECAECGRPLAEPNSGLEGRRMILELG